MAKLDTRLNYLVVRSDEIRKIHLSEISVLIIENTAVSLTAALLCELSKRKIKVIFCDEIRNPYGELMPYYGSHDSTDKLRSQINWDSDSKRNVWTEIVKEKIRKQRDLLIKKNLPGPDLLNKYLREIEPFDATNREGHAAKVYFNSLFGKDFSRKTDCAVNASLNYGYSILLSAINREVSISGYFTQIGLFHSNMFNSFNLGSDLMEPFRPIVDSCVLEMQPDEIGPETKRSLVNLLNREVVINGKKNYLNNALRTYCECVFNAINEKDVGLLKFCEYES